MLNAGRYLAEHQALRAEKSGFLELCYDSAAAADVTLRPIRRFGFDGAILFSDSLVVPHALDELLAHVPASCKYSVNDTGLSAGRQNAVRLRARLTTSPD